MKELKNININTHEQHPFHLVDPSPWPLFTAVSALSLTLSIVSYFHFFVNGGFHLILSLILLSFNLYLWFSDIVTEATFEGHHTFKVQQNILFAMALFITSEVMFFFSFFWAFFHFSLSPSIFIGGVWPPAAIHPLSWKAIPLLNTCLLIISGVLLTLSHKCLLLGKWHGAFHSLLSTIVFGAIFTLFQAFEYINATFSMNDSVYGSIFYMTTGFHGIHVIIGTIFLIVCAVRLYYGHFFRNHHVGFTCAAWYWHFVDVVWIFLFLTVYIWGS